MKERKVTLVSLRHSNFGYEIIFYRGTFNVNSHRNPTQSSLRRVSRLWKYASRRGVCISQSGMTVQYNGPFVRPDDFFCMLDFRLAE